MATLDAGFESDAREAILDEVEGELVGRQNSLVHRFVQVVHNNLRSYGRRHDYDVEPSMESFEIGRVERSGNTIRVTVEWTDPQFGRWEFGIEPHEIRARNAEALAFVWEDPPQWVREEFNQARDAGGRFSSGWMVFFQSVDHPGIPESRALRDAINGLRELLRT